MSTTAPEIAERPATFSTLEVSVVIPCLNEAESIEECVSAARKAIDEGGYDGEVLVVDNASTDGSGELAAEAGARVVLQPKRGYGNAYLAGLAAAHDQIVPLLTRPHAELVAVGINRDRGLYHRRNHQHAGRLPARVRHLVRPLRADREANNLAALELLLAGGMTQSHRALEHEQPLLVAVLVVVGADRLARWELVDAAAEHRGADGRAEA